MKSNPTMIRTEKAEIQLGKIPESVVCELSAALIPAVNTYFKQPGIKAEFETWKAKRQDRMKRGA